MHKNCLVDDQNIIKLLDNLVEGVITINDKGIILSFNKTAETMFGYRSEEAIGQNVSMLMPESERIQHHSHISRYIQTDDAHIIGIGRNVTAIRNNGELFPMRISVKEYPSGISGERWFISSCLDITLQKQQEDAQNRRAKMEALGNLTAGIAHDFNNILGVIGGYNILLSEHCFDDEKYKTYIKKLNQVTERGVELVKRLLAFSRDNSVKKEYTDINELLNNSINILTQAVTVNIKINMHLSEDLWPVFISKGCLEGAILNMSINAKHAMPEGGILDFATANINIDTLNSQLLGIPKGDYIELTVSDTGIGMTGDLISHIFDPFYTTKGDKGSGLGLSQVYNFAVDSGGTVKVFSKPGHGSTFSIYLPKSKNFD